MLSIVLMASFLIPQSGVFARGSTCGNFLDVYNDEPLCEAAYYVRDQNIFEGYTSGNFMPNLNINRAEIIKVALASFLNEEFNTANAPYGSELGFTDIPATQVNWWHIYLERAKDLGAIQGYADGSFRAVNPVSRAEFLKMFIYLSPYQDKVKNWNDGMGKVTSWTDVPDTAWYADLMAFADQNGLLENLDYCGPNWICPDRAITRGEVAQLIHNYSKAFDADVGFPYVGLLTKLYSGISGSTAFMVDEIPDDFDFAFKVPARVFNGNEAGWGMRNVDCSEAPDAYTEAQTRYHHELENPWIRFYVRESGWDEEGEDVDFYFNDEYGYLYGPFNDRLGDLREDIEDGRCLRGSFTDENYDD